MAVKSPIPVQQRQPVASSEALRARLHWNMLPWALPLLLAGCMNYRPAVPPSESHLSAESVVPAAEKATILPTVSSTPYVPPPQPKAKATTYSVVVHEVPVKELLLALARDTKENIDIHPGLQGLVSLNAIDETLPAILERISKQVNMRYRVEGRTIIVSPDTPFLKTYKVNYVNLDRNTTSSISVSGQIGGTTVAGGSTESGGTSETSVKSTSKNDFWQVLQKNVESILASSRNLAQSADQRQARAEAARKAREEKLAQAEAVARAGQGAKDLFDKAFGPDSTVSTDLKQDIIVNPIAGTLSVMATERQQALVQQYLDMVTANSSRQVLIECTIAEVQLSNTYQAGVDWSKLASGTTGFSFEQNLTAGALGTPPNVVVGYAAGSDLFGSLRMLEQFGKTRVLSSPKIMTMNNQTALLKVVDNVVYFTIQQTTSQAQTTTLLQTTTTPNTVAVGVVLSLTPQVNENGAVTITVRPSISKVSRYVKDPNPGLKVDAQGNALKDPIENLIPEIVVREMESVLQLISGQTAVLGGLIQDNVKRDRNQVPFAGSLPTVGDAFAYRDEQVQKSELVIFIRPTMVTNPSLDSDELKHLRKLLPEIDKTGKNP